MENREANRVRPQKRTTVKMALWLLAALAICPLLNGCGPSGPETIPIRGVVILDDGSVPRNCTVYFQPTDVAEGVPLRPATANVGEDGAFEVTSFRSGDGIVPGTYKVKIVFYTLRPGGNPELESHWTMHTRHGDDLVIESDKRQTEKLQYQLSMTGK